MQIFSKGPNLDHDPIEKHNLTLESIYRICYDLK